jgi:hypothetical protein
LRAGITRCLTKDRGHEFGLMTAREYVTLTLTLPVNYDAQL